MNEALDRSEQLTAGLTDFLLAELGAGAEPVVSNLALISSIGNAREPWSFTASWNESGGRRTEDCVMLLKAEAGQLETSLAPEFGVIAMLDASPVPTPPALWCDQSGAWLGQPFFVTGTVAGSASMRPLRVEDGDDDLRAVAIELAAAAAELHRFDWQAADTSFLEPVTPEGVALAQLDLWQDQFDRHRLGAEPGLQWAFAWLRGNAPVAERVSIVHGDLRFGNLLYEGPKLTALLDWEMTHLGDPTEDLGWVYRELWSPRRSLPFEDFLAIYEERAGTTVDRDRLRWYQAFGEVKHSVISLTGARSFHDRLSLNLRHADRRATNGAFLRRFYELVPA